MVVDAQYLEVLIAMEKILVIQTAFIGDAVLTLPMIEKLNEKFPSYEIDVLCIPSTEEIFKASPFVSQVLVMYKRNEHRSLLNLYKFANEIKNRNYSKIFSPHRSFRTSFIIMQSGVRETHGFSTASWFHVYKNVVEYKHKIHEVQRNFDLIGYEYTDESWKVTPKIIISEKSRQFVKQFLLENELKDKVIAIAPGSIWETKKYPEKYYQEIVKQYTNRLYKILVIGSEKDEELCKRITIGFGDKAISTAGRFSIIETIELLKNVKLLVTNDSAPTHFGMCEDIPVFTIYCSTIPGFGFFPYNKKSLYISYDNLNCKPCGFHGYEKCPIKTFDCGYKLDPQMIISKMDEILSD